MNHSAIDRVMAVAEAEGDDHLTSHWILARKVLGESKAFAFQVAAAFRHHKLTRQECEGMVKDWEEAAGRFSENDMQLLRRPEWLAPVKDETSAIDARSGPYVISDGKLQPKNPSDAP